MLPTFPAFTLAGIRGLVSGVLHRILVIAACTGLLLTGCSKSTEREIHETPCGTGKLVLELKVVTHPPAPSDVKFTLALVSGGRRRVVDVLKPRATLWASPVEAERHTRLKPAPDSAPVFVNPREFSPAEYDQIRERLQATHGEFDSAAAQSRTGVSFDYSNELRLSSIRYVDYGSFRRTYTGSKRMVTVAIQPDGAVWLSHFGGGMLLGNVVEAGRKVVLERSKASFPIGGISDPIAYALTVVDARGRRIADEFTVEKLGRAEYDAAMARDRAEREK